MNIEAYDKDSLRKIVRMLERENKSLKEKLDKANIPYESINPFEENPEKAEDYDPDQGARIINPPFITEKMAVRFFSMFWGREDVYAKRGKKGGYFPQCDNRWNASLCPKQQGKKIFCNECEHKKWTKVSARKIIAHLIGNKEDGSDVIGVYPLLPDGTCRFIVFDFDNHEKGAEATDFANIDNEWHKEVDALRKICIINGIKPLVERSRSGRGAHVWIFFKKAIPAGVARNFGFLLLDKGSASINLKSFHYYDRMYPSQDIANGIGNLIALPLQGQALKDGNSAFVDENWNAYPNQWDILFNKTEKLSIEEIEQYMEKWRKELAEDRKKVSDVDGYIRPKPWRKKCEFFKEDVVGKIHMVLSNGIYIDTLNLMPRIQNQIRSLAAFDNPEFYKNKRLGYSNYYNFSAVYLGKDIDGYIQIPRGLREKIIGECEKTGIPIDVSDEREIGHPIRVDFKGDLRIQQELAAEKLLSLERAQEQGIGHYFIPRYTRVVDNIESKNDINKAYNLISDSKVRNEMIIEDVKSCINKKQTPVILTRFKNHAKYLYDGLKNMADHVFLLYGDNSDKKNAAIRAKLKKIPQEETLILIATGQKIGEGFDFPRLDVLMLVAPVSFEGRLEQYVGRLNRDYEGKEAVYVYDYIDSHIRFFDRMYAKRLRTYKKIGFSIWTEDKRPKQIINAIYDSGNYTEKFEQDLVEAEKTIVISSPNISQDKIERFLYLIKERQEEGVKVTVITTDPEEIIYGNSDICYELIREMEQIGINVITKTEVEERFAVIDDELVWHGGMNLLGKVDVWDNLMRIKNQEVAVELLEMSIG